MMAITTGIIEKASIANQNMQLTNRIRPVMVKPKALSDCLTILMLDMDRIPLSIRGISTQS